MNQNVEMTHQTKLHQGFYFPCTHTPASSRPSECCNQANELDFDAEA